MPYNETFEKLKAAQNPAFAEEIEAVKDNQTFFIGAYESSPEGNIPKGDFNEIFQALLNNDKALKKLAEAIQARTITAGKGLQGGGALSKDVTLNVVSVNDAIIVNDNDIQLNPVNDLTTGGTDKALSGEMGKKLNTDKQNKTDSRLQTESKEIIGAINESLWSIGYKVLSTVNDFNDLTQSGVFYGRAEVGTLNTPFTSAFNFVLINYSKGGLLEQTIITGVDDILVRRRVGTRWYNWEKTLRTNTKEFLGNAGISSIIYIQDSGTKTQGQGYIDKDTGQVYLCLETNTDTTITNKFMSITNVELGKKVESGFWKLNSKIISDGNFDILGIYEPGFYRADSDGAQANWLNKPYVNAMCYGLLYQKQNGNRRSVIYIGSNGGIYTNVQLDNSSSKTWIGWKKAITDADIIDNLTTADKSKVLSSNMGKYLDENKPSKNKVETITNYWTFEGNTPFIKFKKTGEQSLPSAGYSAFIGFGSNVRPHELQIRNLYGDGTVNIESTDLKTKNKNITKAINEVYNNQLGNSGISSIIYIQDAGQKTAGNGYVDKTTGQLYLCKTTNSDTSVTSNFVLATNIEIAKRHHFTKTILFDKPTGHGSGAITLSDNWENYDEFIVYGSSDNADYVGSHRFKKEDIEYSISKNQRYMIYGEASDCWLAKITTGSKTWASGDKWEKCAIFRIIGIKYGG
jgi:hypothetical protein